MGLFDSLGSAFGIKGGYDRNSSSTNYNKTTQKMLSQEGIDKIIYDIMSSDQGLAALATAENASGGYGSSTKTLMAQDLIAKVAGEIANITAPTVETGSQKTVDKKTKVGTVICTYLAEQGYIPIALYLRGIFHTINLPAETRIGYLWWAEKIIPVLKKNPWLCRAITPMVRSRYEMIVNRKFSVLGAMSIYIGQPICFILGVIRIALGKEMPDGYVSSI